MVEIAGLLPIRSEWGNSAFHDARDAIRSRYSLSSNKFQTAARLIQENRQTKLLLGIETELLHISDDLADFLVCTHLELNPREEPVGFIVDMRSLQKQMIAALQPDSPERKIKKEVLDKVSLSEIADVRTVFYIARNNELPETYEDEVERRINALERNHEFSLEILAVFKKTNFVDCFIDGIERLGRATLGATLRSKYCIY